MKIAEVSDVDLAFPANGWKMLPDRKLVEAFVKTPEYSKWSELFSQLFYKGSPEGKRLELDPREGTPSEKVWRMVRCMMGTYGCKHEHKHEGVAYTLHHFFSDYRWVDDEKASAGESSR